MGADCPKQYLPLLGRPVLLHTLERLASYPPLRGIVVGISPQDDHWAKISHGIPKLLASYIGGEERAHTVLKGLEVLGAQAAAEDWVLVHDAVRPCLRHADIDRLMREIAGHPDGGLLALPLSDTVKRADDAGRVIETVARGGLWRALTPQVFPLNVLLRALTQALQGGLEVTDEAMAVERSGGRPRLVPGHADNIKITVPGDLVLAEFYLREQGEESA